MRRATPLETGLGGKLHRARELAAYLRKTAKYGHSYEAEFLKADADLKATRESPRRADRPTAELLPRVPSQWPLTLW
jgi:hypothetical protein